MSADLFAAFEVPSQAPNSQQNQSTSGGAPAKPSTDPFSFIASPPAIPQPQTSQIYEQPTTPWPSQQPTTPWPSLPQQQTTQPAWTGWPAPQPQPSQTPGGWGDLGGLGSVQSPAVVAASPAQEDDDGWGDFEAPVDEPLPVAVPSAVPSAAPSAKTTTAPPPVRTRITRASTIDMLTNNLIGLDLTSSALETRQERPSWEKPEQTVKAKRTEPPPKPAQPKSDPNVLFDADDFELQDDMVDEEDDFGDFETVDPVPPPPKPVEAVSAIDLLSSESGPSTALPKKQPPGLVLSNAALNSNPLPYPQAPKSPYGSFQTRKPEVAKALQVKTPLSAEFPKTLQKGNSASPSPVTAWPSLENDAFDSDWAEFKDKPQITKKAAPPKAKTKAAPSKASVAATSDWEWNEWGDSEKKDTSKVPTTVAAAPALEEQTGPPPTNIPPPSIILSIFPELLNLASNSLLKPMSSLPQNSQQRVLSDSSTTTFLRGYLALATVAARVIAGRKQRWHRDKFLMQSMSISAASGGKTRGMKLAGVDKAQAAREDREAGEVVAAWKQQVGRLKTAVATANKDGTGAGQLKVPELSVTLSAHVAPGTVTAPKACVICGLKRDERIARVDYEVEDSFGEWWVEFWGHRDCRNFWLEHEVKLRQR